MIPEQIQFYMIITIMRFNFKARSNPFIMFFA